MQRFRYSVYEVKMKYRAILKKSEGWWIGWLVDLPGVNAQERTKVSFEPDAFMTTINVPDPEWVVEV
jgi:hypothetical protein